VPSLPLDAPTPRRACRGDEDYPQALLDLPDPPRELYWIGAHWPPPLRAVAVVGSRAATAYGREVADALAGDLARAGICVVSGLARGVDAHAHRAALAAGGDTVAVLAAAPQCAYPPDMLALHQEVLRRGAACAEFGPARPLRPGLFVRRNRIVSGLALGVVGVEAGPHSGALTTARAARRQGRFVAAVPADVTRETSLGCLALLRAGATAVGHAGHVLALVEEAWQRRAGAIRGAGAELDAPAALLAALGGRAAGPDALARRLGWSAARAQGVIASLEMAGALRRLPGGRYRRTGEALVAR
jgi:DNA processing protein